MVGNALQIGTLQVRLIPIKIIGDSFNLIFPAGEISVLHKNLFALFQPLFSA